MKDVSNTHAPLLLLPLPLLLLLAACGDTDAETVDRCYGRTPTITTGIYGCATQTDDVGPPDVIVLPKFPVHIYREQPPYPRGPEVMPFAQAMANDVGFFELALEPGSYWACRGDLDCHRIMVSAGAAAACDYDYWEGYSFRPAPRRSKS